MKNQKYNKIIVITVVFLVVASVANALNGTETSTGTWTVTDANSKTLTVRAVQGLTNCTSIPAADSPTGADLTINGAKFIAGGPFTQVESPNDNPATQGWYEQSEGNYTKSTDTSVDNAKTYYTKTSGAGTYVFEYTDNNSKKHYKVIKVGTPAVVTP